ncbi:hypothetical protein PanWU01x14_127930 [Parasponia andersonii]|uniref:Uncharacterized protein n=1 Tax=Parasponia andersonii TaxID=3476 RepID=A0A2P5CSS8_PARAD|nr:hypothetical protein PanWU01x14_127930 [Parasponia andersonii]
MATQAQVFYLSDMKRGVNWQVGQKVNHRGIYDILETTEKADESLNNEVFQEESTELPPFQLIEEVIESSSLIRRDVEPLTIPGELVMELNINNHDLLINDNDDDDDVEIDYEEDGFYDNGNLFFNNEEVYYDDEDDLDSDDNNDAYFDDDASS